MKEIKKVTEMTKFNNKYLEQITTEMKILDSIFDKLPMMKLLLDDNPKLFETFKRDICKAHFLVAGKFIVTIDEQLKEID